MQYPIICCWNASYFNCGGVRFLAHWPSPSPQVFHSGWAWGPHSLQVKKTWPLWGWELQMLTVTYHCEVLYGSSTGDQAAKTVSQVFLLTSMLSPRKLVYLLKHKVTPRWHLFKTTDFPSWFNFLKTILDGQQSPNISSMVWSKSRGRWRKPSP